MNYDFKNIITTSSGKTIQFQLLDFCITYSKRSLHAEQKKRDLGSYIKLIVAASAM